MDHKLSNHNEQQRTAICSVCGPTRIKLRDKKMALSGRYRCFAVYKRSQYPYIVHKKDTCDRCSFIPEHPSQLDVDHIDGNNQNNNPDNLQTLCANCHRLKTIQNKDWKTKKRAPC